MANKRLDYDKIYELVMQCRQSGLSDKQWCLDNNIAPSTFYYWIRRLQQKACYDLPETASRRNDIPAVEVKQDVVCVNIQPDSATKVKAPDYPESANVMLQYGCFLQVFFGKSCKIFLENVASPNWRKLQSLDWQLSCQPHSHCRPNLVVTA